MPLRRAVKQHVIGGGAVPTCQGRGVCLAMCTLTRLALVTRTGPHDGEVKATLDEVAGRVHEGSGLLVEVQLV